MIYDAINIFPTTIYVGEIENHSEYKEEFYKIYPKFQYEQIKGELVNTVSENQGNPLIHLEENLDPLFREICHHIKNYLHDVISLNDILDKVPDEFYNWVKSTKENFEKDFVNLKKEYESIFNSILLSDEIFTRKDFALKAINTNFPSILFDMYDKKDYEKQIWKILYPSYSKPFKNEYQ
jgi:hypothetical protein